MPPHETPARCAGPRFRASRNAASPSAKSVRVKSCGRSEELPAPGSSQAMRVNSSVRSANCGVHVRLSSTAPWTRTRGAPHAVALVGDREAARLDELHPLKVLGASCLERHRSLERRRCLRGPCAPGVGASLDQMSVNPEPSPGPVPHRRVTTRSRSRWPRRSSPHRGSGHVVRRVPRVTGVVRRQVRRRPSGRRSRTGAPGSRRYDAPWPRDVRKRADCESSFASGVLDRTRVQTPGPLTRCGMDMR